MCGRYVQIQEIKVIEKKFNVNGDKVKQDYSPNYNISHGDSALVITGEKPKELQLFTFGLIPYWAKKKNRLVNARAEGDYNKSNDPNYKGGKGILQKPSFRKPIRSQRCLVIADAFIEGTNDEKLKKPYCVYLRNKHRPFAFAGIWDTWIDPKTGEIVNSFAIITTTANNLIGKIPHDRSPVILNPSQYGWWISSHSHVGDITRALQPYPAAQMNAYPIDPQISSAKQNGRHLLKPIGDRLEKEFDQVITEKTILSTRRRPGQRVGG